MSICAKAKERVSRGVGRVLMAGFSFVLIPVAYGADLASGVSSALGCSGGATSVQTPGITSFGLWNVEGTQPLAVANDGFFMIVVSGKFISDDDLLGSLAVEVTSAEGALVSGRLHTFPSNNEGYARIVYWLADAPIPDGTYTGVVSAPANDQLAKITRPLEVHGAPTPLTLASVEPSEWLEYHLLTGGKQFSCIQGGLCSPVYFNEIEESFPGVRVHVTAPAINGQAYWEASVQRADGSDPAIDPVPSGWLNATDREFQRELRFGKPLTEYCVVLKMTDLRDKSELTSPKICWKPGTPTVIDQTGVVTGCSESPSPALLPLWCKGNPSADACTHLTDGMTPAGTAGSAGTTQAPGGGGNTDTPAVPGNAGSAANSPSAGDAQSAEDSSSACSVGHARGASSLGVGALLAFAALAGRRRATRSRATRDC